MTEAGKHKEFMRRIGLMVLKRRMNERLDKCCHGGIVSYRLPLWYRIGVANRTIGSLS